VLALRLLEHAVSEKGFLEHAVSENVYAGGAMTRPGATYMYGALLPKGPGGQVGAGLGQTTSLGTVTLIAPTVDIAHTGQEEIVDGGPDGLPGDAGTEAPAEMNFLFPTGARCAWPRRDPQPAQHPHAAGRRGVRDAYGWAGYLVGRRSPSSSSCRRAWGASGTAAATSLPADFIVSLSDEQLFDAIAVQIDGPRAGDREIALQWRFTDTGDEQLLTLRHGVLTHRRGDAPNGHIDASVHMPRTALDEVIAGTTTLEALVGSGRLEVDGDAAKLQELLGLLDRPTPPSSSSRRDTLQGMSSPARRPSPVTRGGRRRRASLGTLSLLVPALWVAALAPCAARRVRPGTRRSRSGPPPPAAAGHGGAAPAGRVLAPRVPGRAVGAAAAHGHPSRLRRARAHG
jgi:hypothetical protein